MIISDMSDYTIISQPFYSMIIIVSVCMFCDDRMEETMSDIIIHNRMGRSVYKRLPAEISGQIDKEIYRVGLLGPDPYAAYRFFAMPFRHGVHEWMSVMHDEKTADFLVEMAKAAKTREMFSYLAGFLCHYALDTTVHPYIDRLADNTGYMHVAIEHKLDLMELDKMGMDLRDRPITRNFYPPFLPKSMQGDLDEVFKKVYGWDDAYRMMKASYRHHKMFYYLAEDPHGLIDRAFGGAPRDLIGGRLVTISYRSHLCDGMTFDEFDGLRKKAVHKAIRLIEGADSFRKGTLSEAALRDMIGHTDYSGRPVTS